MWAEEQGGGQGRIGEVQRKRAWASGPAHAPDLAAGCAGENGLCELRESLLCGHRGGDEGDLHQQPHLDALRELHPGHGSGLSSGGGGGAAWACGVSCWAGVWLGAWQPSRGWAWRGPQGISLSLLPQVCSKREKRLADPTLEKYVLTVVLDTINAFFSSPFSENSTSLQVSFSCTHSSCAGQGEGEYIFMSACA